MKQRKLKSLKTQPESTSLRSAERYSSLRDLHVSYEGHSDTVITRLPDLSTKGMFINTAKTFPEGAVLNVRFRLARTGALVESRCEVRYCLEGVGIGVEFVEISTEAAAAIEREIHPHSGAIADTQKDPGTIRNGNSTKSSKMTRKRRNR